MRPEWSPMGAREYRGRCRQEYCSVALRCPIGAMRFAARMPLRPYGCPIGSAFGSAKELADAELNTYGSPWGVMCEKLASIAGGHHSS